jgi:hypothetical protein
MTDLYQHELQASSSIKKNKSLKQEVTKNYEVIAACKSSFLLL